MKKSFKIHSINLDIEVFAPFDWVKRHQINHLLLPASEVLADFMQKNLKVKAQGNMSVQLVPKAKIKTLNKKFRAKNAETDVLSFPMQDSIRLKKYDVLNSEVEIGDIFICKEVCLKQAREFKITVAEEFIHLFVHGFLHLVGYDHELSAKEEKLMNGLEQKILDKISKLK